MSDPNADIKDRKRAAEIVWGCNPRERFRKPEELVTLIEGLLKNWKSSSAMGDGTSLDKTYMTYLREAVLFGMLVAMRLDLTPKEQQADVFFRLLERAKEHPYHQVFALIMSVDHVYTWPDRSAPLRMAEAVVKCLESGIARYGKLSNDMLRIDVALQHLTPENLPTRLTTEDPTPPPEFFLAAWREWLERFRQLPLFRPGAGPGN